MLNETLLRLESENLGTLDVLSGALCVCGLDFETRVEVPVANGKFLVRVHREGRKNRAAVAQLASAKVVSWDELGSYPVDTGLAAFADKSLCDKLSSHPFPVSVYDDLVSDHVETEEAERRGGALVPFKKHALSVCWSGEGDGVFPVFAGRDKAGKIVAVATSFSRSAAEESVPALINRAQLLLLQEKDPAAALEALAGAPEHAAIAYFRAAALDDLGRANEAWAEFERAAELHSESSPSDPAFIRIGQILSMHALLLKDLGGKSLALCQRAVARDPLFGMSWHFLGYFLFMAGDLDAAARALEVCSSIEPERIEQILEDDDFGDFRTDPRFVRAVKTKPLNDKGRAALAGKCAGLETLSGAELQDELRLRFFTAR